MKRPNMEWPSLFCLKNPKYHHLPSCETSRLDNWHLLVVTWDSFMTATWNKNAVFVIKQSFQKADRHQQRKAGWPTASNFWEVRFMRKFCLIVLHPRLKGLQRAKPDFVEVCSVLWRFTAVLFQCWLCLNAQAFFNFGDLSSYYVRCWTIDFNLHFHETWWWASSSRVSAFRMEHIVLVSYSQND